MRTAREGAADLRLVLDAHGGALAGALQDISPDGAKLSRPGPAQTAAAGPKAAGREREYELLIEMILEGSRLHYGSPWLVRPRDPDLALLLGDQLYALGLARLAALGDLHAVAELGDVISLVAEAHAASDQELADAIWEAGAAAIGWGASEAHEEAKELARARDSRAVAGLRAAARASRGS